MALKDELAKRAEMVGKFIAEETQGSPAELYEPIGYLFEGGGKDAPPGVQPYPAELEQEIARLWVELRGQGLQDGG